MPADEIDRLVEALRQDPGRRRAVLSALLTDDFLVLPNTVAGMETRLVEVEARLVEMDARLTARLDALAEQVEALTTEVRKLVEVVHRHDDQLGDLRGWRLEDRYRLHGDALLSSLARRLRLVQREELMTLVEDAEDAGSITMEEAVDVRLADAVFAGRGRDGADVYLVVEVSAGIGPGDVARARRRADILAKLGVPTTAVVAGERIDDDPATLAAAAGVEVVTDGSWARAG
ncbi:MAG: hypothetical protein ACRDZQ_14130 [Acidimicrobiales bacterium]